VSKGEPFARVYYKGTITKGGEVLDLTENGIYGSSPLVGNRVSQGQLNWLELRTHNSTQEEPFE